MTENRTRVGRVLNGPESIESSLVQSHRGDPVARFLTQQWRTLVAVLVAGGLAALAYNSFQTTADLKRAAVSEAFAAIQKQYRSVVEQQERLVSLRQQLADELKADPAVDTSADKNAPKDPAQAEKDRAERQKSGQEQVERLQKEIDQGREKMAMMTAALKGPAPIEALVRMYQGLLAARLGDFDGAQQALQGTPWQGVGANDSPERLTAEFATLGLARALLDSEKFSSVAGEALEKLAREGSHAAVQAALSYAGVASSEEEKQKARDLLDRVAQRFPTQQKFVADAREQVR
jgi:hypothetical protein